MGASVPRVQLELIRDPPSSEGAARFLPATRSLERLAEASRHCEGCELFRHAIQTVFGRGEAGATLLLVGEQPGDAEDRKGAPFVGPAGRQLEEILREAGIDRGRLYVTNAVKHFKWTPRGKRRMHARPVPAEVSACRPWLMAEIAIVRAPVLVCLGATAAQSLLGTRFRLVGSLGKTLDFAGRRVVATYHPSAILRAPSPEARDAMRARLKDDLSRAYAIAEAALPSRRRA